MKPLTKSAKNKSVITFFILAFLFALPSYILVGLAATGIILSPEMAFAFVPLSALAPIGAALLLTFKESGRAGMKKLLSRSFDHKRVVNKKWYLPTFFLLPVLFILAWGVAMLLEQPLIEPPFPVVAIPIVFLMFFGGALGEEVGWMGYAFEPMQEWWSALKTVLVLGAIWGLWHLPLYIYLIVDPVIIAAQMLMLFAMRLLFVWLFNNSGKSVFVMILFHTIFNVTFAVLPVNHVVSSFILMFTATIILFLWGSETLAEYRWKKKLSINQL